MKQILATALLLALSAPALAQSCTLAVVDFEKAVTETREGKAAQARLDSMFSSRKTEIDRMRAELEKEVADYQGRAMLLSETARKDAERGLMEKQGRFEQTYMRHQQEMQQTYMELLQGLDVKMRAMTEQIARDRGCQMVLDKAAVVYIGAGATDLTINLIQKYDAASP